MSLTSELKFGEDGLIPAIVQEKDTGRVLMQAYMNAEAVRLTVEEKRAWFYSRSREQLWLKGESSGHFQNLCELRVDCDGDSLLLVVEQEGSGACHTGHYSCFYRSWKGDQLVEAEERTFQPAQVYGENESSPEGEDMGIGSILSELEELIRDRREEMPEGSYTTSLFSKGESEIRKKVGEEAVEVILAGDRGDLTYEVGDLFYHLLVLLAEQDLPLQEVADELAARRA